MRRYWIPACLASEIAEPDGPPVRVKLMGEDLVAFRDSEGQHRPPRRILPAPPGLVVFRAQRGMRPRCVYHGWKFDVEGNCLDQLNEPPEHQFKQQDPHHRLSDRRIGRHRMGLSGAARQDPGRAEIRLDPGAPDPSPRHQGRPGMQLAAGFGGRARHLARADHASPVEGRCRARRRQTVKPLCPRRRALDCPRPHRLWLSVRRHQAARRRADARPHLSFHPAVPPDPLFSFGARPADRRRAYLGARR